MDEACHVAVNAMEKSSGQKVDVEFDDAQPHLTGEEIKHLLQQNEVTKAEDEKLLKVIEAKNRANSVIPKAEAKLREYKGEDLTKAEYDKIEKALAELGLALDDEDAERIRTKAGELLIRGSRLRNKKHMNNLPRQKRTQSNLEKSLVGVSSLWIQISASSLCLLTRN